MEEPRTRGQRAGSSSWENHLLPRWSWGRWEPLKPQCQLITVALLSTSQGHCEDHTHTATRVPPKELLAWSGWKMAVQKLCSPTVINYAPGQKSYSHRALTGPQISYTFSHLILVNHDKRGDVILFSR